jgi:hypothetical protein
MVRSGHYHKNTLHIIHGISLAGASSIIRGLIGFHCTNRSFLFAILTLGATTGFNFWASVFSMAGVYINSSTPELNPSAQRCLTRFLLGILLLQP